ncbi:MAG: hypothetical protein ACHQRO_17230 [Vicinamibacteria bacterium]
MRTWSHRALAFTQSEQFGNAVIILFFVSQALDGALTYLGVTILGRDVEGNPLLHWLMGAAGHGPALALAKLSAAGFGIVLHLASVHRAVAILTLLYLGAAVVPWMAVLAMTFGHGLLTASRAAREPALYSRACARIPSPTWPRNSTRSARKDCAARCAS